MFEFGKETFRPAFEGQDAPKISYGLRFPEACQRHCRDTFSSSRAYVICSKTLSAKTDALERLTSALGDGVAGVRIGIDPHTPITQVLEVVRDVRDREVDCIITLGAGSLTDAAKLVRLALANDATTEEDIDTLWGTENSNPSRRKNISRPTIPLIHIPTSLSGGEYQTIAGATESQARGRAKRTFKCEGANPELVVQDPELCITTPAWVWLSTGVRSVDHCVETLCSLRSNADGDAAAKIGLPKLIRGLLESKASPQSLSARHLCQEGVVSAMFAVSTGVPLGASHAIGHQLGPLGVGHGETSCILLPAVCRFNYTWDGNRERQDATRDLLLGQEEISQLIKLKDLDREKVDLGDLLDLIISALGVPRTLNDVGVAADRLALLARNSLEDLWIRTNPVPITEEAQVMHILKMCIRQT